MPNCSLNTSELGVTTLTLNRPDKHNAFNAEFMQDIADTLEQITLDRITRVLLINANGRSFCAGADLEWMKASASWSETENINDAKKLARMLATLNSMPMPTIALVEGAAYGGGVGLVACCDIAIATENAKFALTEVKLGLIPATISPFVLDAIGTRAARRYFLTGETFDSEIARDLGLIHELTTTSEVQESVNRLIKALLAGGPKAQSAAKLLVQDIPDMSDTERLDETAQRIARTRTGAEAQEGLDAFFSKRHPHWIPTSESNDD